VPAVWDWYLGQAGFGEQIQRYGETFWPELVSTMFWTFLVLWAVLVLVAIVVTLSRHADVNEETGNARGIDRVLRQAHTGTPGPRTSVQLRAPIAPEEHATPPKVA
jgi:hypothetical protein